MSELAETMRHWVEQLTSLIKDKSEDEQKPFLVYINILKKAVTDFDNLLILKKNRDELKGLNLLQYDIAKIIKSGNKKPIEVKFDKEEELKNYVNATILHNGILSFVFVCGLMGNFTFIQILLLVFTSGLVFMFTEKIVAHRKLKSLQDNVKDLSGQAGEIDDG